MGPYNRYTLQPNEDKGDGGQIVLAYLFLLPYTAIFVETNSNDGQKFEFTMKKKDDGCWEEGL